MPAALMMFAALPFELLRRACHRDNCNLRCNHLLSLAYCKRGTSLPAHRNDLDVFGSILPRSVLAVLANPLNNSLAEFPKKGKTAGVEKGPTQPSPGSQKLL